MLSTEYPTLAFHASITNPFGKGALIQLLRQFGQLHSDKKQISVGFIGYPNVGKSSIINTLRSKKVCNVAPIPGQTKVWQYITLFKRIFLIDCPGVVYPSPNDSESDIVLKGVVRIENLKTPQDYIQDVLDRVKHEYIVNTYGVDNWEDYEDFLAKYAQKTGKLLKGGEPDLSTSAKMVLQDWQRGRIPYFVRPPFEDGLDKKPEPTKPTETAPTEDEILRDEEIKKTHEQLQPEQKFRTISVRSAFTAEDSIAPEGFEIDDNYDDLDDDCNADEDDIDDEDDEDEDGDNEDAMAEEFKRENELEQSLQQEAEGEEDLWDELVDNNASLSSRPSPKKKQKSKKQKVEMLDEDELIKNEFASDDDEDTAKPAPQKEKLVVLNRPARSSFSLIFF